MRGRRRGLSLVAGLAALLITVAACGGGGNQQADEGGSTGGSFSTDITEPSALGPSGRCYESECSQVLSLLYTGLVDMNMQTGELIYRVAESVESDDQQTWTITLKENWTFHNGEPVNADAFIRAWNWTAYGPNAADTNSFFSRFEGYQAMNPSGEDAEPEAEELSGLEKLGEYQFEVTLNQPFSQFPQMLLYIPAFAPLSQACLDDVDACNEQPIGNGPYQMAGQWEHDRQIALQRWADYPGRNAGHADEITFKIYQELTTAFNDWLAGNLDVTSPPPEQVAQARQEAGDRLTEKPSSSYTYLGLPTFDDTYSDPRVRHALSLAIDRQAIAENIFSGLEQPARSVIPPIVPGHRSDACERCQHDPQRAQQLMQEAGGFPEDEITIWFNAGAGHEQWTQAVANQWKKTFNVDFSFESMEWSEYLDKMEARDVNGPFRMGWRMDYPSAVNYLKPLYFEDATTNYTGWSSDEFENLVQQGSAADSQEQALQYYQQAEDLLLEEMPIIPLFYGKDLNVWSEDVENVTYDPLTGEPEYTEITVVQ